MLRDRAPIAVTTSPTTSIEPSSAAPAAAFLFSVDLEDVRSMFEGGHRYPDRVPHNTRRYLDFLARHRVRCTFFTVGDVARRHPSLVREIAARGHEIACHSSDHVHLDRQTPETFADDLDRCLEDFDRAGVGSVTGYRAPAGTLRRETAWAYDVLRGRGFRYSSSVIPSRVGSRGWSGFGSDRPTLRHGLWELPFSVTRLPGFNLPFCAGVFFRVLPFPLVRALFRRRLRAGDPVTGYFHPYDIDPDQDRFPHPEVGHNPALNWLMYRNRHAVLGRLEDLAGAGWPILPYSEYVERVLEGSKSETTTVSPPCTDPVETATGALRSPTRTT